MEIEIITTPHLPTGKVCHLLCGCISNELQDALLQHVSSLLILDRESAIEPALQTHADIAACPLPDKKIIISKSQLNLKEKLISLGFYVIMQESIESPYPNDCLLNFINTSYYSICNSKIHYGVKCHSNVKILTANQGYVKCSVVPVAPNAILTDDPGIARAAKKNDIQVCFVSKGDVGLPGYPYGFIGGCCGKLSARALAFCGNAESHRDYKQIYEFLKRFDIEPVNLLDTQLIDVGSLIPLTQEKG